jgi:excisionase family DNA binding protein
MEISMSHVRPQLLAVGNGEEMLKLTRRAVQQPPLQITPAPVHRPGPRRAVGHRRQHAQRTRSVGGGDEDDGDGDEDEDGAGGERRPSTIDVTKLDRLPAFLTADETAALLRTTRKAIYAMVERNQLPGAFRIGRRVRVRRTVLLDWISQEGALSLEHQR